MNIVGTPLQIDANGSFTLTNGDTPGRGLLILAGQWRNPPNLSSFTFNSVAAQVVSNYTPNSGYGKTAIYFLPNANLPSAAGSYVFSFDSTDAIKAVVIELSDAEQDINNWSLLEFVASSPDLPFVADFSAQPLTSGLFASFIQTSTGTNMSGLTGQVDYYATGRYFLTSNAASDRAITDIGTQSRTSGSTVSYSAVAIPTLATAIPTLRKGSQFDVETTLAGTVTSATLNGAAITVDSHVGTTVTLTDSDGSITTSGEYPLVLTDNAAATETITVQVNVYGVAPSNNPLQKDGAALASLTDVEVRVSAGATLAGSQLFYSGTATTDVSGNLGNIDLSSTAAADADPVLLSIRTAAGDSIIASETVGII